MDKTFKSGEKIDLVETERRNVQYLYQQGADYIFMDEETFEQYTLSLSVVSEEVARFLKEEQRVVVFYAEGEPISLSFMKQKIPLTVKEAPPGVKGDTVSNAFKTVTLETGASLQVPLFIQAGESVLVNVETGEYVERVKQ